ncbi:EAL domain-containing protein [Paenibacillus sinopodophylli]|uniref:EAL domain-containing protein n=1 Tax=Paenibacillus sinopodophylli TaxID=1837342 RepID=UPI001485E25C|nr:EAL domain-containing protein [Paenibacillus sinopodophylli]
MQRKPTIGLLTPFLGGNYLGDIINGIQKAAHQFDTRLIAIRTAGKPFNSPIALDHVDGWIILNNAVPDDYIKQLSSKWKKPIITIAKDMTSLEVNGQMVVCNNEGGIMDAMKHLYEHGHVEIGFVGNMGLDDMKRRYEGYIKGLEQLGLPFHAEFVINPGDFSVLGGRSAAQNIADAGFPFKAAVVCTDMTAIGMLERLTELGCRVPEDFALIGFDNTDSARTSSPSMTSIDQHIPQAAARVVELLLGQIKQPVAGIDSHMIDCTLVRRESCGCTNKDEVDLKLQRLTDCEKDSIQMTQLNVHYEFNKFIQNYSIDRLKDLSWVLAPHFQWASQGLWQQSDNPGSNLQISQWHHFHRDVDLLEANAAGELAHIDITQFPMFEQTDGSGPHEDSEMTYVIPYRTVADNWSVLAFGTTMTSTLEHWNDYMSIVHYLDLIANTLDRQALIGEVSKQSLQYRQIAEQLEIVSRTSNDGIWELDLRSGGIAWNQRFYDLLQSTEACRFEALLHADDLAGYLAALKAHLELGKAFMVDARLRKQSGQYVWVVVSGEAVRDESGVALRMVGSVRDITERKQAEDRMRYLAYHDTLTGLTNRRRFYEEIALASTAYEQSFAVIVMDLDHFKKINDSFGHQMGDRLLQLVADGLKALVKHNDHIARFGGDEFVILYQFKVLEEVEGFAKSISKHLSTLLFGEGVNLTITMSAGISIFPIDGADPDTLIKKADIAMYKVKQSGKNDYEIFSPLMIEQTMWRINTENELKEAIAKEQFTLYYQPQIDLATGELFGVEALLRWDSPEHGIVSPLTFIPLAEETGLIIPIGEWVISEACRQSVKWRENGCQPFEISVNISGRQLKQPGFVDMVRTIIEQTGMDPQYLCFEITESTVIDDLDTTIAMFRELASCGIQMSMDDFGTGYSSLSVLRKLPLNMLKIDKSFISEMTCEHQDIDIVKAIIFISNSLNLRIIAEGVEQEEQQRLLKELGCHCVQGYYISKPLTAEQFELLPIFTWKQKGLHTSFTPQ